ncbi:hypothetical protein FUA23_18540 [Neolewinella aurantiaca]|uniref:Lipoprotein n=1 Tax=Neolewinella aurantiaca TaxID=2602767 RepID=A0A5C7FMH1_9BACT|nr:hypothetical protein [Neolewinella aurantiaca]TXF87584.1 hypothetical protein FUA23_18540 [Neolewinella aurantiaca]
MKLKLLVITAGLLLFQCTVNKVVNADQLAGPPVEIIGVYRYVPDSVSVPNRGYREILQLNVDSTFTYEVRQGGLVNYSTMGTWGFDDNHVILLTDASYPRATVEETECSNSSEVRVRNQAGDPINFVVSGKLQSGVDTILFSSTVGFMKLTNLDLKEVSVLSPSGIASPDFDVKKDECSLIKISLPNRRTFDYEKWRLLSGKIKPLSSRGETQGYYLHLSQ